MKYFSLALIFLTSVMLTLPAFSRKKELKATPPASMTIKGVVKDQLTHEKLAGVSIQCNQSQGKIYTDSEGAFIISTSEHEITTLKLNCISYENRTISLDVKSLRKGKFIVFLEPVLP